MKGGSLYDLKLRNKNKILILSVKKIEGTFNINFGGLKPCFKKEVNQ